MSSYNGRRPNVTQYLRDLNALSPQDADNFAVDPDIALFTNTEFFDYDSGQNTDYQPQPQNIKVAGIDAQHNAAPAEEVGTVMDDMSAIDFMSSDFTFPEFAPAAYAAPPMNNFPEGASTFQPLQPVFNGQQPPQQQQQQQQQQPPAPVHPQVVSQATPDTRSPDAGNKGDVTDDASRAAAEDDKRRRNTAASARFRVKKKQREQALEKSAKELKDQVSTLVSKVSQLETENKWLKNLLVEKNDTSEDISTLWKEFTKHVAERSNAKSAAGLRTQS